MWSRSYTKCIACGSTKFRHVCRGLCNSCYMKRYRNDPQHAACIKRQKDAWRRRNLVQVLSAAKIRREDKHFCGLRESALQRDKYRCVACSKGEADGVVLTVHHKDGKGRGHNDPDNSLGNLEALCRACHIAVHRKDLEAAKQSAGWAKYHNACTDCGTTDRRHAGRGLCTNCYRHVSNQQRRKI